MAEKKEKKRKKKKKEKRKMNIDNPIKHPLRGLLITRQLFSVALYATEKRSPRTLVQSNVVRSRLIILINEEINEANGPDKIVAEKKKKSAKKKKNKINK